MMNEKDENALLALIAKAIYPEAHSELSREEIERLLVGYGTPTEEERAYFEGQDPMSLIDNDEQEDNIIPFTKSSSVDSGNLPLASGFYRGGQNLKLNDSARDSIKKKRDEIIKRLKENNDDRSES